MLLQWVTCKPRAIGSRQASSTTWARWRGGNPGRAPRPLRGRQQPVEPLAAGSGSYYAYLEKLHSWAHTWGGETCEPDVVERVVFDIGQASRLAVCALSGAPYAESA